jgi:16S rRNA (cytosine1402-N4)-methyltransferase
MDTKKPHITVLLNEAVDGLNVKPDGIYLDATYGRGGHSQLILSKLGENGRLIAIDRDLQAAENAKQNKDDPRFSFFHQDFASIKTLLGQQDLLKKVDGILLDLGVSSPQLDQAERGFSFQKDGPLDMRMDRSKGMSAAEWVNEASVEDMKKVFKEYGEEKFALRIARGIETARKIKPISRTIELAEIVDRACPVKDKFKHPATRTFQAIRIFINDELGQLKETLENMFDLLSEGGRMSIISFHSLEDRMVKRFIKEQSRGTSLPKEIPITEDQKNIKFQKIGKAIKASNEEVSLNPRSRSAVLRIAQKC